MLAKITLTIKGEEKTFQQPLVASRCRAAYAAWQAYSVAITKDKGVISSATMDNLVDWVVETFNGQFTAKDFWDGYSGSFLDLVLMMQDIVKEVSSAIVDFPKRAPEATAGM